MPSCAECKMLANKQCQAHKIAQETLKRVFPPHPFGGCIIPIVESYCHYIEPNMRVLDVGCGSWSYIRDYCEQIGARYEGIDVVEEYFGEKTVATRLENLAELSFDDETFDLVIGNQTMEHWAEHGCTLPWGLYQCFRVLKTDGRLCLNVPIHFHGTKEFMLGQFDVLYSLFEPFASSVIFTKWGNPSDPLPQVYPHPGYWALADKPAFILDIQAVKDRPVPSNYSNKGAVRGRMAQLVNYPPLYNVYRVLQKFSFNNGLL